MSISCSVFLPEKLNINKKIKRFFMSQITKLLQVVLSTFPKPLVDGIRKVMPMKIKRSLGRYVMDDVIKKGGTVTVEDGRIFNVIKDRLFFRVFFEKSYEPLLSAIAIRLIEKGDNVIDVGANFGWYSTLFNQSAHPGGSVTSYEPSPYSYKILIDNIKLNNMESSISVRNSCAGEESGIILLEQGFVSESGLAHVVSEQAESTIEVPVVTLDEDLSHLIGEIAYIKIDVEGYEFSTLKGAKQILEADNQPIIQIELNDEALERAGTSRAETVNFLESLGYSFWAVSPDKPGTLKKSDTSQCSDVFCFGQGVYGQRVNSMASL